MSLPPWPKSSSSPASPLMTSAEAVPQSSEQAGIVAVGTRDDHVVLPSRRGDRALSFDRHHAAALSQEKAVPAPFVRKCRVGRLSPGGSSRDPGSSGSAACGGRRRPACGAAGRCGGRYCGRTGRRRGRERGRAAPRARTPGRDGPRTPDQRELAGSETKDAAVGMHHRMCAAIDPPGAKARGGAGRRRRRIMSTRATSSSGSQGLTR